MKIKVILILVILALVVVLLVQNRQVVDFNIFFWKISASQVIFVPLVLFLGFLIGVLVGRGRKR